MKRDREEKAKEGARAKEEARRVLNDLARAMEAEQLRSVARGMKRGEEKG